MDTEIDANKNEATRDVSPSCSNYSGIVHTKKVIKHALRQQVKRRRKNTTIASGNSRSLPRIAVKPLPSPPTATPPLPVNELLSNMQHNVTVEEPAATMREVLASLPGFCLKSSRRRSTKRLSAAAQLEAGLVDLESPASILSNTSLRALLNRHTFQGLPPLYQRKLAQLLPSVDRQDAATSGLNNEFFARACLEWRKRLAEGEFTPENQQKLKMEAEKDKNKLDPWKLKHFEPIWGDKREPRLRYGVHRMNEPGTGGAVTRSSFRLRLETNNQDIQTIKSLYCRPVIIMPSDGIKMIDCPKKNSVTTELSSDNLSSSKIVEDKIECTMIKTSEKYESADNRLQNGMDHISLKFITNGNLNSDSKSGFESKLMTELSDSPTQSISPVEISTPIKMKNFKVTEMLQTNEKPNQDHESISRNRTPERIETEKSNTVHVSQLLEETIIISATSPTTRIEPIVSDIDDRNSDESLSSTNKIEYIHQNDEKKLNEAIQCPSQDASNSITELTMSLSQVSEIHLSHDGAENNCEQRVDSLHNDEKIFKLSACKTIPVVKHLPPENDVVDTPIDTEVINADTSNTEPLPEAMEIDSETLRRIHELEVRGEMREAYEEISGCSEEAIYPLLEGMEMGSNGSNETLDQTREIQEINITENNEDEELRDANNYVCSEMLECSWPVDSTVNNNTSINSISTPEDLQVSWPLVAAALDGSVAANITVTTQEDSSTLTDIATPTSQVPSAQLQQQQQQLPLPLTPKPEDHQFITNMPTIEPTSCKSLPFQETILMDTPTTSCLMTNIQSQSPPILSFPPLPAVRFVPRFHQNSCHTTAIPTKQLAQQKPLHQDIVQLTSQSSSKVMNNTRNNFTAQHVQGVIQGHIQSAIIQHPTAIPVTQSRQIMTNIQHPQYTNSNMNIRTARTSGQGSNRSSRSGNKDQSSGRSKSSTKEPPGAVNLERSYQICQAVIQSSPNRDQLKAHLKPPPSLLARGDAVFTSSKTGGRTITTVKSPKQQSTIQHGCKQQNKASTVMLRPMIAPTRQAPALEAIENSSTMTHFGTNTINNFGQYILVQRTGVSDSAPRASSAPPLPPQLAGVGVGVHLVRGRPASAGEGSHQAVTLKAKVLPDSRGGGAEPGAPDVIIGGDPPPPCECSMRSAMAICQQCGAFCHDDCIGPQRICATCLIR